MVQIRRLDRKLGDRTTTCTLQQATEEVKEALNKDHLVVDETDQEKRMLRKATGLTENSKVAIFPRVAGG